MPRLALSIGAALAILAGACTSHRGQFSLRNKATEKIVRAGVTICGQRFDLRDIDRDRSAVAAYRIKGDSHYHVQVEFQSGRKMEKDVGYVTNGLDFQHEITVTDSDIEITNGQAK